MAFADHWRQIWAIIRRYGITVIRHPIKSFLVSIAWPAVLIGPLIYALHTITKGDATKNEAMILFIRFASTFSMMTTIFHAGYFGEFLIKDKATGLKSLMISSGLKRMNYYCGNSICSLMCLLPISLIMVAVTKEYLVDDTVSLFSLIALLTLFALHIDSFILVMVSFITSPSYSIFIYLALFFGNGIHMVANLLLQHFGDGMRPLVLFLASMSPSEPVKLFYDGYLADHGYTRNPTVRQENYLIFSAQIVAIIAFRLFAYWFEEVCPWQTGSTPRSAFFFLDKEEERFSEKLVEESDGNDGPLFERIDSAGKEIGIAVKEATKSFDHKPAVDNVSFTIYKGEATLLLGHNGAGKSTLMNMILGLLKPNSGRVKIRSTNAGINSLGYCPQTSVLDENLNVRQHLELFNDIKSDLSGAERQDHIKQTISDISLGQVERKLPAELSGGMKRKLSLGIALVGKSEVLILDEPSSGLDPDSRTFIWNAIRQYRRGRTVLLSTQHMEEADYLGDRIAIMSAGQIICCGSSIFLNRMFGRGYKLRVECMMSKREQALRHIRRHFSEAQPLEEGDNFSQEVAPEKDINLDFVVELKSSGDETRAELQLIELLEEFENNKHKIGVISYGLKSSSIEDVMLETGKMFPKADQDNECHLTIGSSTNCHLNTLTQTRSALVKQSKFKMLSALCTKHIYTYLANPLTVLIKKVLLPVLGSFNAVNMARITKSMNTYWQSPVAVAMVAHFIHFPVKERVSKFKMMQLNTALDSRLYWLSFILVDLVTSLICVASINIFLVTRLNADILVPRWQLHGLLSAATLLFCLASMMLCYLLSNIIDDSKTAYNYVVIVFALSSVLYIVVFLLRLALLDGGMGWIQDYIGYVGVALLPNDAYSLVYIGLYTECYIASGINKTCVPSDGFSPIAIGLLALAIQAGVYCTLLSLVENHILDLNWYLRFENICGCFYGKGQPASEEDSPDQDVQNESAKAQGLIKAPFADDSCLVANGLHKSYSRSAKVIRDLSFTVQRGECFGLLGVNGAGKSTTFSMLCGESRPDAGRILAGGTYLDTDLNKYRASFGYDPQSSPEMSLTANQALRLMAKLRGLPEPQFEAQVYAILDLLSMSEHGHKLVKDLSGGTKRKLALGMALIGSPPLLALDEPTAGVDPLARRGVWQLLKLLRNQKEVSIVISSHAMEECEAICDRITIMARGRLRCIGSFLHLRSKFARGCSLRVMSGASNRFRLDARNGFDGQSERQTLAQPDGISEAAVHELEEMLEAAIGRSTFKLADRNSSSITFDIMDDRVRRSILFRMMREFKTRHPNSHYSINDSSLEEIFITLAKEERSALGL